MNLDMMLDDSKVEGIKKMIVTIRDNFHASDSKILDLLVTQYGDDFSKEQLQQIMNQVK